MKNLHVMMDEGLKNHKQEIESMHQHSMEMDEGLKNHKQEIESMHQQIAELERDKLVMLQLFRQLEMQFESFMSKDA